MAEFLEKGEYWIEYEPLKYFSDSDKKCLNSLLKSVARKMINSKLNFTESEQNEIEVFGHLPKDFNFYVGYRLRKKVS